MKHSLTLVFLLYFICTGVGENTVCVEDTTAFFQNLALNKSASQSSLYDGFYDNGLQGFAWRANDGNKNANYRDKSCSHAALILDNHWWQVDLEDLYNVTSVTIVNRDKLASRLRDFGIEVSLSGLDDGNGRLVDAVPCHYHAGAGIGNSEERPFPCTAGAVGQHVRIYMPSFSSKWEALTLCEVEVSGYKMDCFVQTTSSMTTTQIMSTSPPLTTEVATIPAVTTDLNLCVCSCVNKTIPTMAELVERVEQLKKNLTVDKKRPVLT